jgi:hypothetical protein
VDFNRAVPETPEELWPREHYTTVGSLPDDVAPTSALWHDVLPPVPEETWREDVARLAAALRTG